MFNYASVLTSNSVLVNSPHPHGRSHSIACHLGQQRVNSYIGLSMRLYTLKLYSAIMDVFRRFEILKDYLQESTSLSERYHHDLDVCEELQSQNKN